VLIHVDCLVTADAPNGLICIGQQLAALSSNARLATLDLTVFPARSPRGVAARRSCRDDVRPVPRCYARQALSIGDHVTHAPY
jgi:hypothetical protein